MFIKAELLQEGIFFLIHFLVMKKLEIEKTKPTFITSVLNLNTRSEMLLGFQIRGGLAVIWWA